MLRESNSRVESFFFVLQPLLLLAQQNTSNDSKIVTIQEHSNQLLR